MTSKSSLQACACRNQHHQADHMALLGMYMTPIQVPVIRIIR
jgi:hypothetical protein